MAMLITGGRDAMRNHMYGAISQDTANFIQSQIASLTATYGDVAAGFQNNHAHRSGKLPIAANGQLHDEILPPGYTCDNGYHCV